MEPMYLLIIGGVIAGTYFALRFRAKRKAGKSNVKAGVESVAETIEKIDDIKEVIEDVDDLIKEVTEGGN
jgi:methyl-accepting chemotaxis protein